MTLQRVQIVRARGAADLAAVLGLLREYGSSLEVNLEHQGLNSEFANFPGGYAPPSGDLLLATRGVDSVGCVALREYDHRTLEMKRLYVRPVARGLGLGKRLIEAAITIAKEEGYSELRLDTLGTMIAAQRLYRTLGFGEIDPYGNANLPGMRFYALRLGV
jgi:putative acetyltransferase